KLSSSASPSRHTGSREQTGVVRSLPRSGKSWGKRTAWSDVGGDQILLMARKRPCCSLVFVALVAFIHTWRGRRTEGEGEDIQQIEPGSTALRTVASAHGAPALILGPVVTSTSSIGINAQHVSQSMSILPLLLRTER
ncbi:hypothetical protein AMECASPLE_009775, partial [Ameca splendens]